MCFTHCALCIVLKDCELCLVHYALCITHCALRIVHYALCIMHYNQSPILNMSLMPPMLPMRLLAS